MLTNFIIFNIMPTVNEYLLQYGVGNMTSKYLYATCEPFNRYRHGYDSNSSYNIDEYQLIIDTHISFNGLIIAEHMLKNRNLRHIYIFMVNQLILKFIWLNQFFYLAEN